MPIKYFTLASVMTLLTACGGGAGGQTNNTPAPDNSDNPDTEQLSWGDSLVAHSERYVFTPTVATSSNGTSLVAWVTDSAVKVAEISADGASAPQTLYTGSPSNSYALWGAAMVVSEHYQPMVRLQALANGNMLLVWSSQADFDSHTVYARIWNETSGWGETTVLSEGESVLGHINIMADADHAMVVLRSSELRFADYNLNTGHWSTDHLISDHRTTGDTAVATANGRYFVANVERASIETTGSEDLRRLNETLLMVNEINPQDHSVSRHELRNTDDGLNGPKGTLTMRYFNNELWLAYGVYRNGGSINEYELKLAHGMDDNYTFIYGIEPTGDGRISSQQMTLEPVDDHLQLVWLRRSNNTSKSDWQLRSLTIHDDNSLSDVSVLATAAINPKLLTDDNGGEYLYWHANGNTRMATWSGDHWSEPVLFCGASTNSSTTSPGTCSSGGQQYEVQVNNGVGLAAWTTVQSENGLITAFNLNISRTE